MGTPNRTTGFGLADVDVARQRVARRAARPAARSGWRHGERDPARRSRALSRITLALRNPVTALSQEVGELQASLDRRFRVAETQVDLASRTVVIRHPANADDLISEEDFVRDDRLPYWADIWPSARVLAARLLEENGAGRSLIELGCGAGLVSAAAAIAGFDVVATDYYEDALRFARVNANRNAGRDIGTRLLDWRDIAHDIERFDCVVASDVLYERTYGTLVASTFDRLLARDGFALMADPGRISRDDFLNSLEPLGLVVTRRADVPYEEGEIRQTIAIIRIERMIRPDSDRASIDAMTGEGPPLPNPSHP
jgi:ETFB lysine methyltransferase